MGRLLFLIFLLCLIPCNVGLAVNYCEDANCQGAWLFTEGSGTTVADSSANTNTGNFASDGHPAWSNASLPAAYTDWCVINNGDFADYIDCGGDASLDFNRNFTIIMWIYPDTTNYTMALMSHGVGGWYFRIKNTNKLQLLESNVAELASSNTSIANATWQSVVVTVDNASPANITFFLDGTSDGGGTTTNTLNDGAQNATIGADVGGGSEKSYCRFTAVAGFSRTLDSTEINDIMDNGLVGGAPSGPKKGAIMRIL